MISCATLVELSRRRGWNFRFEEGLNRKLFTSPVSFQLLISLRNFCFFPVPLPPLCRALRSLSIYPSSMGKNRFCVSSHTDFRRNLSGLARHRRVYVRESEGKLILRHSCAQRVEGECSMQSPSSPLPSVCVRLLHRSGNNDLNNHHFSL